MWKASLLFCLGIETSKMLTTSSRGVLVVGDKVEEIMRQDCKMELRGRRRGGDLPTSVYGLRAELLILLIE